MILNPKTLFDCVAVAAAGVLLYAGLAPSLASSQVPEPRLIDITVRRYAFEPARIEVTEDDNVRLVVRSADGVHGFRIKKFGIDEEVPRGGEPLTIEFTATASGQFPIVCSQFCGKGHDHMKALLIVRPRNGGTR